MRDLGLHPKNQTAIDLYRQAARDQRVGTMAGCPLLGTLTATDARNTLDIYDEAGEFSTFHEKRVAFEKMMLIDQIATCVKQEAEEAERKRQEQRRGVK